jgi:hypothetical protein
LLLIGYWIDCVPDELIAPPVNWGLGLLRAQCASPVKLISLDLIVAHWVG